MPTIGSKSAFELGGELCLSEANADRGTSQAGHSTASTPLSKKRFGSIEITPENEYLSVFSSKIFLFQVEKIRMEGMTNAHS
jgi:hypothetical protein